MIKQKYVWIITILVIIGVFLVVRSVQRVSTNENSFNDLVDLLSANQKASNYVAFFERDYYSSGGSGGYTSYNFTVNNEVVVQGPSDALTATALRNKTMLQITNWTQDEKDKIVEASILGKRCFQGTGDYGNLILCFDDKNNLVYQRKPGQIYELWIIPSLFLLPEDYFQVDPAYPYINTINDIVGNALYKAQMAKLRKEKILGCDSESCKLFFSLLDAPSEHTYKIREEYQIKPYNYFTSDYTYILEYSITNEELKSFERTDGVYGASESESMLKAQLSEFQLSCSFVSNKKDGLTCFEFEINAPNPKCELQSNYYRNNCSYCFDENGYLVSGSCLGNGYWNWEK